MIDSSLLQQRTQALKTRLLCAMKSSAKRLREFQNSSQHLVSSTSTLLISKLSCEMLDQHLWVSALQQVKTEPRKLPTLLSIPHSLISLSLVPKACSLQSQEATTSPCTRYIRLQKSLRNQ